MRGFRDRMAVEDVVGLIRRSVRPLASEPVAVSGCAGRVLAVDVIAPVDVPGFDRAAMDGYAVRGEDTFGASADNPLPLRLTGESRPGRPFEGALRPGEAVRIMTGAVMPVGGDTVVMAETAREEPGTVQVLEPVPAGKNVGLRGEDVAAGTLVLAGGRRLRPQDAGLLAALGISPVPVVRRPAVDLLITGDELLPPGSQPATADAAGRIPAGRVLVDSNSVMLSALVGRDGGLVRSLVHVADTAAAVRAAFEAAAGDVVIVSGGSSVGLEDHAPRVLAEIGELAVHGIAMRPSSPAGVGFLAGGGRASPRPDARRPVFLVPGNPVSCLCAYDFFAGAGIRGLGGLSFSWPYRSVECALATRITSPLGRLDYTRVRVRDGKATPVATSGASILSSTVRADGFVLVEPGREGYATGERVRVFMYDMYDGQEAGADSHPDMDGS